MYHNDETANGSYGRRHNTRCNECGAEFSYRPIRERRDRLGIRHKTKITEMKVIKEGQL